MYELKKCPYCGGDQMFSSIAYEHDAWSCSVRFKIRCKVCGAGAPGSYGSVSISLDQTGEMRITGDDRNRAVEASNKRADNG